MPDVTTNEDSPLVHAIDLWAYASDLESPDSSMTYTIAGTTDANAGVTVGINRYINIDPAANWNGTATVTVQVSDGLAVDTDTFDVTVLPVNDTPAITGVPDLSTPDDTPLVHAVDLWAYANDVETAASALTYTIVSSTFPAAGVSIDANRYINVTPTLGSVGTSLVTVRASDGAASSTDQFYVEITLHNATPTISGVPDLVTTRTCRWYRR